MSQLLLTIVLVACGGGAPPLRSAPGDPLEPVAWLQGAWVSEEGTSRTIELWLPPDGATMIGLSRTVQNGRTVDYEWLRLESRDGAIVYVASPSGQATTEFTLVSHDGAHAVFENLEHDFPQRVSYAREGDRVTARVEDASGQNGTSWTFRRASLP